MKTTTTTIFLLFFLCTMLWGQETKRAFFIGNSYTYFNTLPALINQLANANGDTLIHASSTQGGAQLVQHVSNATTLNGIRQGNWDYVVIQEQSQKPSFPPSQVAVEVLPYASQLNDSIELYNPCGETVFFMTWGRQNGDAQNCQFYPPLCTYAGMQNRLRSSYLLMTDENDAICSPVGAAWKVVRDSFPSINLYTADGSHPSYAGSYLAACTFYATLFRKSPVGLNFYGNLSATDAQNLQNIAAMVVLDSLPNWSVGTYDVHAAFTTAVNLDTVQFNNNSTYTNMYHWDFGDGSAISTATNPQHIYDSSGTYTVSLIATDSCDNQDTITQQVVISIPTHLQDLSGLEKTIRVYPNPATTVVTIEALEEIKSIRLMNALGEEIFYQNNIQKRQNSLDLRQYPKGLYYLHISPKIGEGYLKKVLLN